MDRDRVETVSLRWLRRLVIAAFLLVTVFPFYYMLVLSVRPIERLLLDPGSLVVGLGELTVSTYSEVLRAADDGGQGFLTFMRNSGLVAVAATLLTLLVSIPGAYAVSRLRFFGRRQVHFLFLAVYLFPSIVIAIPLFVVFTRAGLRGSLFGLILVYISQTLPVSVYMLKNYFETIPVSLEESAAIDGAGRLGVIRRVSLPLAMPSIMAVALYDFMIAWNEFLFALLFLVDKPNRWTVSLGLAQLADGVEVPKTVLMAGSVILTLPIVILFFASERLLTEGLTSGAEKG
ncbi:carbohydrate ABC transporter permease [Micromonospora echinaurantiaca]|uniref:Carbohydrate ABC transporter membrane protein 2, CUT1 family n=1 Tax=Micromonospora echinaurantiaca TaxID=47857 RepID=A0A1C5IEZ8_9ACTN|nr:MULTISPECIES: carbohydrate ABC transporter permease [Micromonospora]PWU48100.1 carbohydrate ABC transporter permease [Micromonospora sp. S4605]SCG56581.1 carbohydrate ABC transporter membrane protein 2, CUT1 family [Micromonospora echinaurantiaca]